VFDEVADQPEPAVTATYQPEPTASVPTFADVPPSGEPCPTQPCD
jgi:hypothetical protein